MCCTALQGFVQRAGPEIVKGVLPPKHELVVWLMPSPLQRKLLQHLLCLLTTNSKNHLRDMAVR
jgi:hypothetical protein